MLIPIAYGIYLGLFGIALGWLLGKVRKPKRLPSAAYHHDRKPVDPCWPEWKPEIGEALQAARKVS